MINFTLYAADCTGNSSNCLYPHKMKVTDKDTYRRCPFSEDHYRCKFQEKKKLWRRRTVLL